MLTACTILQIVEKVIAALDGGKVMRKMAPNLLRDQRGVSALEFSLFAPIVMLGFLAVADLAFMAQQNMAIGHVLRAGAQEAMLDKSPNPEAPEVLKVLGLTAAESFNVNDADQNSARPVLYIQASRYCLCPDNLTGPHLPTCKTVCTGSKPPLAFYMLSTVTKSSNMLLPQVNWRSQLQVQVR